MKLIDRYTFTNGKAFETWYLDAEDLARHEMPECDVIGLRRVINESEREHVTFMRPDEALILARLLIGAVHQVSEGYRVGPPAE